MKTPLQEQIEQLVTSGQGYPAETDPSEDLSKKDSYLDLQIRLGRMELRGPEQNIQKTIIWYQRKTLIDLKTQLQKCDLHYSLHTMEAILFFQARLSYDQKEEARERRQRQILQQLDRLAEEGE